MRPPEKSLTPRASRAWGRSPGLSGTRAAALACAVAALPVAALSGCARPTPAPVHAGSAAAAATSATVVAAVAARAPSGGPGPGAIGRFRWSARAKSPLGPRESPIVAWADGRLLEFGGLTGNGSKAASAGAAFSPATGRWRRVAPVPAAAGVNPSDPSGLSLSPASAWTGRYLAVANGPVTSCPTTATAAASCWTGIALYDPAANRWTMLALPRRLDGLEMSAVAWTGRDIVVGAVDAAAFGTSRGRLAVAAYTPATRGWRIITPAVPRRHPSRYLHLVDAGGRLLLWSLWDRVAKTKDGFSDYAGVDVLALNSRGAWRNVTGTWPQNQFLSSLVPTPDGILVSPGQVWCGIACSPPPISQPGYFANPSTLARKAIPPGPLGQAGPAFVWAGKAIIAVDLYAQITGPGVSIQPGDLALFDPATSRWARLPATPDHQAVSIAGIWTGTQLLTLTSAGHLLAFHR